MAVTWAGVVGFGRAARCALALLALLGASLTGARPVQAEGAQTRSFELQVGQERRTYLLTVPNALPLPAPTVIALHAAGQTSQSFRGYFGLDETAAREGFVAVYPQGAGRVWNDGRPAAMRLKAVLTPGDDVPFLVALTQKLIDEKIADPARIYLVGISNGGFMVERMACEFSGLFAAYGVIMATAPANYRQECHPARPVPIMFIHGTADTVIHWNGFWTPVGSTLSAPDSAQLYAGLNGCGASQAQGLPDRDPLDATTVSLQRWSGCADNAEVRLYRVERGGHQSPARADTAPDLATPFLGLRNHDIDAGTEAWAFFSQYSLAPPAAAPTALVPPPPAAGRMTSKDASKDASKNAAKGAGGAQPPPARRSDSGAQRGISTQ